MSRVQGSPQLAGPASSSTASISMNHAASPSTSSIVSSSLDDSSMTEQGSEVSAGGKPSGGRGKRRLPNQQAPSSVASSPPSSGGRTGKKRQRTATPTFTPSQSPSQGRKRGKGKTLPLRIPAGKTMDGGGGGGLNGGGSVVGGGGGTSNSMEDVDQTDDDESVHTSTVVLFKDTDDILLVSRVCLVFLKYWVLFFDEGAFFYTKLTWALEFCVEIIYSVAVWLIGWFELIFCRG